MSDLNSISREKGNSDDRGKGFVVLHVIGNGMENEDHLF